MITREIASDLPLGYGDPRQALLYARLLLLYLADHIYGAELANGASVSDASDFSKWCLELAEEVRKIGRFPEVVPTPQGMSGYRPEQRRWDHLCPDCDHEAHAGREACGEYLGEGKFCQCPSKVTA